MTDKIYSVEDLKQMLYPVFASAPIYQAILFGSYAKGNATENSDVDIVIDSQGQLININFYGVLEDITETLDKPIDLFETSEVEKNTTIYDEIFQKGVLLYERQR